MTRQATLDPIVRQIDGDEISDIQLVEKLQRLQADRDATRDALRRASQELAERILSRGQTEAEIGEHKVVVGPKCQTEYDQSTLGSLKACVTDDQLWITMKQLPSGKQLKALSDLAGASAKSVIASAKRRIETDTMTVKIKKRSARRSRRR